METDTEVEQLLKEKKIHYSGNGRDLLVHCLNPDHDDSKPSMRIDRDSGIFHCLSCGYKGSVFTRFNKYRNIFSSKVKNVMKLIKELREASWSGYEIPTDAFFVSEMFRGIPANVIQRFDAFRTDTLGMSGRVVFPISDNRGVIVGFQGRHANSDSAPKYLMYPAEVSLPWYPGPNKLDLSSGSIIIVEGILDALYLHSVGITNAVTIFGTKSVNMETIEGYLTPFMLAGVQTVHIMMDGDKAGYSAAENIEKCILYKTDLVINNIKLPEGKDPATMSDEYLNNLKNFLQD